MTISDVRERWDFGDPARSRGRFEAMVAAATDPDDVFVWSTQLARTWGLEGKFDEAHQVLDAVAGEFEGRSDFAKSYFLLERGRAFNSSGKKDEARPLFARAAGLGVPGLRVDALHMLAITANDDAEGERLNREALAFCEASDEAEDRSWRGSLLNNLGWSVFDQGRAQEALAIFEEAVREREVNGTPETHRIARWCVGRALREVGRYDEALALQKEIKGLGSDKYVDEEIAELEKVMAGE